MICSFSVLCMQAAASACLLLSVVGGLRTALACSARRQLSRRHARTAARLATWCCCAGAMMRLKAVRMATSLGHIARPMCTSSHPVQWSSSSCVAQLFRTRSGGPSGATAAGRTSSASSLAFFALRSALVSAQASVLQSEEGP